jgi:hypothetical protein
MIDNNFLYSVSYNTDGEYFCESSGCQDEGICRCYSINNIIITSVDILSLTEKLFNAIPTNNRDRKITQLVYNYDPDSINKYCINRILTINKIYDSSIWTGNKYNGYYGDEVDKIQLNDDIFKKVNEDISSLLNKDTIEDKINYILQMEYGYILPELNNKKYTEILVDINDIDFRNKNHYNSVLSKNVEYYMDNRYNLIKGICFFDNGKWRVIDGYHRLSKTKNSKVRIIGIK